MSKKPIKSDLERIDAMGDKDIDYSDIPPLDDKFFEEARVVVPPGKKQLTLRLDADVLEWLKSLGPKYQTRINAILRSYYETHKDDPPRHP